MTRVLVVDDEPQLLRALRVNLRARGYEVETAADGTGALRAVAAMAPDLVVLDLGLPGLDGMEVLRSLRGWSAVPVIVLSGRAEGRDKVRALEAGADDYVTKPFGMAELIARIRAVTRRRHSDGTRRTVRIGGHTVDLEARTVTADEGVPAVRLTPTEWRLLDVLASHPGKLVSGRQLLAEVWGPGYVRESHYLRQYLAQLRRKLEPEPSRPRQLLTEPGMGYRFQP
ncbi:winged helix family two component transcriptional regulator [Actinocorallia herbida]|uniref:Winged helix family two component transcriptional regulator n=1 Tax=Actinocorallia herbida TaxID=58109 RepID=A0A3N1DCI1_9ACTN|nr:response regulator [Actinocorallia herbida]ROO91217.1 winged helix family two component transcriptional regulator [Actinocorallia herbida]